MRHVITLLILSFMCNALELHAQLRINDWQSHLPASLGSSVTQSENKVFYAAENQLVIIDKTDGTTEFWSKVEGLSDVGLSLLSYHPPTRTLILTYENSNIDFIRDGQIINVSAIRDNRSISGDKRIFHIGFGEQNNVFFSCGFGLVEYFLDRQIFGATLITPVPVQAFASWGSNYYIGTTEGLYRINPGTFPILSDFNLWESVDDLGLSGANIQTLAVKFGALYAGVERAVLKSLDGTNFTTVLNAGGNHQIRYLSAEADALIAGYTCPGACPSRGYLIDAADSAVDLPLNCFASPAFAVQDAQGRIWFADLFRAFRNLEPGSSSCITRTMNTPYSGNVSEMEIARGRLYIASGGTQPNANYLFREDGFFMLENGIWHNYNKFTVPAISARDLRDFFRIKAHPKKDIVYIGNYLAGLIEWKGPEDFTIFDSGNSSLGGTVGDIQRTRISGLEFDRNENLWISNFLALEPISVLTKEGKWKSFAVPGSTELQQVLVDDFGNKWFAVYRNGILVFNEGRNMDDPFGYQFRQINSANSLLPSNIVNCLVKDLDGAIWVGTDQGILVFECGSDPFRAQCRGTDRRLEQDGYGAILLSTENIRALAVDGANRKWIGTSNGLFVQSANGDEPIFNFTTENAPLLDNNIVALKIDMEAGIVYIGTNRGVQAIRTDATSGNAAFESSVYAFPNPVRPEYDGPIAIKGLARDANFKITDLDGRLVFEGRANGGQAIWNGRDFSGRRVDSGVYLVFATYTRNQEFPSAHVTKIAVIR